MIELNEYDTGFFKRKIYTLLPPSLPEEFSIDDRVSQGLIIGRIPVLSAKYLQEAFKFGFELLCPVIDLALNIENDFEYQGGDYSRVAKHSDYDGILNIAFRAFSLSRFHREPVMASLASEYHREWAKNCLEGRQAEIVMVHGEPDIKGFIAFSYDGAKKQARIVLIGVFPEYSGKDIGGALISSASSWAKSKGALKLCVRTEADNLPAVGLYLKKGFRLEELSFYIRKDTST